MPDPQTEPEAPKPPTLDDIERDLAGQQAAAAAKLGGLLEAETELVTKKGQANDEKQKLERRIRAFETLKALGLDLREDIPNTEHAIAALESLQPKSFSQRVKSGLWATGKFLGASAIGAAALMAAQEKYDIPPLGELFNQARNAACEYVPIEAARLQCNGEDLSSADRAVLEALQNG